MYVIHELLLYIAEYQMPPLQQLYDLQYSLPCSVEDITVLDVAEHI